MKKIICVALALVLLCSALTACGAKKGSITEITKNSKPTKIATLVEYVQYTTNSKGEKVVDDTLKSKFDTEIDHTNQLAIFSYSRQRPAALDEASETRIVTEKGSIYYDLKAGDMTDDGGETWKTVGEAVADFTLKISPNQFKTYELSSDGNSATATLAEADSERVLGTAISTKDDSDINVVITTNGEYLYGLDISYTAESGANVVVRTTYTYAPITLDFSVVGR